MASTRSPAAMTFSDKFSIVWDMIAALRIALLPTILDVIAQPALLLKPLALQQKLMANVWANGFGEGVNEGNKDVRAILITPNAHGLVLDIGAGHGHTLQMLNKNAVKKYIAVEPNVDMHPFIVKEGEKAGIPVEILSCGVHDLPPSLRVDTIICVLTLCSVGNVESAAAILYRALNPSGCLIAFEHVKSKNKETQWWQRFWEPVWSLLFDRCRLTQDSLDILQNFEWKSAEVQMKEGDEATSLFVHEQGVFWKAE
ncbi:hypothetical protein HDU98_010266 [Podochytrium sp. JEL0797]|nr:hypothetical protein HDU98_010248 [Podochytrium sp. JEL0797]KAJ3076990.1 hypothetical protein HDU98_010266 [Podochytrium sp. JEL0797]